jgi:hypothetical protein
MNLPHLAGRHDDYVHPDAHADDYRALQHRFHPQPRRHPQPHSQAD